MGLSQLVYSASVLDVNSDDISNIDTLTVQELFFQLIGWLGVELGVSPVGMVYFMG